MTTYPSPSDPAAAFTRAGGSTEAHSVDHGRVIGIWENAKHHGATGDGTTDDTTAVQAAITAASGKKCYIPPGTYSITSTLTVPTGTEVVGAGIGTVLKHNAGSNPLFQINYVSSNCAIRDMKLLGGTGTGDGIYIAGATGGSNYVLHTIIDNILFYSIGDATHWAIHAVWGLETYVSRCDFTGCLGGGIFLDDTSNASVIRDCKMSNGGFGALGAVLVGASGTLIEGTVIEGWRGSYGVKLTSLGNANIIRTWFEDNTTNDLYVQAGAGVLLAGSSISEASSNTTLLAEAGSGTEQTSIVVMGSASTGKAVFNNGTSDKLRVVLVGSNFQGSWTGDVDTSGVATAANFSLVRIGGTRDKLAFSGGPLSGIESNGAGSAFRLEDSKLIFGTSSDSATWGDTNLYRSAANSLTTDDTFKAKSGIIAQSAALSTSATDGFLYIPTCAGTPTGTPTSQTGTIPLVFDTTNKKLYVYTGGAWVGGTAPGVFS